MNRTLKRSRNSPSVISVRIENPAQFQRIFRKGGMQVMIAVSDDTCPHCVKYKPTWETLAKTEGRNVPMISMPSSVYNQTHLAKQKEVKGVPTVLYVSPNGTVNEVEDIRDESKMTSLLKSNTAVMSNTSVKSNTDVTSNTSVKSNTSVNTDVESVNTSVNTDVESVIPTNIPIIEPTNRPNVLNRPNVPPALQIPGLTDANDFPTIPVSQINVNPMSVNRPNIAPNKPTNALKPVLPGVTSQPNPLTPLPGSPVASEVQKGGYQTGGNPWSAFMMAAKQAAPAAALLGVYSMMPRSSGLGRPRSKSRRQRR